MKLRFIVLGFLSAVITAQCSLRPLDTLHTPFLLLDILHVLVRNKATVNLCLERTGMTVTTALQYALNIQAISEYSKLGT